MLVPIRCFTCGRVIADQYDYYEREVKKLSADKKKQPAESSPYFDGTPTGAILDKMGVKRYCCRRMFLGTQDMMETI